MRILLVIYGPLEQQTGGYRYDARLVSYLRDSGHQVELFSQRGGSYLRRMLQDRPGVLLRAVERFGADLILQDELNHPSLIRSNRKLRDVYGKPIAAVVHHLADSEEHGWIRGFLIRALERRYLRSVDGAVYNTPATLDAVARLRKDPLPGVVSLPSTEALPKSGPTENCHPPERRHGLRLLTVGSLIKRKRIDAVIGALALLDSQAVTLTVVGSGDAEPGTAAALRRLPRRLGVGERVTFLGSLDDGELDRAYREHDLFVLPSQYEGFGMVYLEAMARGMPVIAGDAGGAGAVVRGGVNGYLTQAGSAAGVARILSQLLNEPEELARLSEGALETARNHPTWEESFRPAERFLRGLVNKRGADGL